MRGAVDGTFSEGEVMTVIQHHMMHVSETACHEKSLLCRILASSPGPELVM